MRFANYYDLIEQEDINNLEEKIKVPFGKTKYLGNIARKVFGSKTRQFSPKDFKNTSEVGQVGYNRLMDFLAAHLTDKRRTSKKLFIKDYFQGKFSDNDAVAELPDYEDISTYLYTTNKGGRIVVYDITDDEGDKRYFVATDDKGDQFFVDQIGMPFKAYVSRSQGSGDPFPKKGGAKKKKEPEAVVIDKSVYQELIPVGESVEEDDEIVDEAAKPDHIKLYKNKDGKWTRWSSEKKQNVLGAETFGELMKKVFKSTAGGDKSGKFMVVDVKGKRDTDATEELFKKMKSDPDEPLYPKDVTDEPSDEEPKDVEDRDTEDVTDIPDAELVKKGILEPQEPIDGVDKEPEKEPEKKEEPKGSGKLFKSIKSDIAGKPIELKPTEFIKQGWQYALKKGGQFFVYLTKDGEHKIAYDDKGQDYLVKKGIIKKQASAPALK